MPSHHFIILRTTAERLKRQGNIPKALEYYQESLTTLDKLLALDPENPHWLKYRSVLLTDIADVFKNTGNLSGALEYYQEALQAAQEAFVEYRNQNESQTDSARVLTELGKFLAAHANQSRFLPNPGFCWN